MASGSDAPGVVQLMDNMNREEMYELHGLLHILWSKAVGTSDYNKKQWGRMEELISKSICTMLGKECSTGGYLRLIAPEGKRPV
jgi:hypothetical protein